eukprot:s1235_g2.t5
MLLRTHDSQQICIMIHIIQIPRACFAGTHAWCPNPRQLQTSALPRSCGPDANCSRGVKAELAKILEPYRIGKLAAPVLSDAARQWPDVEPGAVRLRLERSDGSVFGKFKASER